MMIQSDELIFFRGVETTRHSSDGAPMFNIGALEPWNFMTFYSVGNVIIPTDY
jgi:hypothetical protein